MGMHMISVTQSHAGARASELGGRPTLQGRPRPRGMKTAPGGLGSVSVHMEYVTVWRDSLFTQRTKVTM